jgi:hypothetical protein
MKILFSTLVPMSVFTVLLMAGCQSDTLGHFYQSYQGPQTNWPTGPAGFVSTAKGIPFYHGLPPVPYAIIGRYDRANLPVRRLASSAKYHHANAIFLTEKDVLAMETAPGVMLFGRGVAFQTPTSTYETTHHFAYAYLITTNTSSSGFTPPKPEVIVSNAPSSGSMAPLGDPIVATPAISDWAKDANRNAWTTIHRPRIVPNSFASGHWIESVMDDGNIIKLEDGSLWQVEPLGQIDSALWLELDNITVIEGDDPEYKCKLINKDENEVVDAKQLQ